MPRFTEEKIAELKQAADIVVVIGDYLSLKRAGQNYKGLCPFHDDHNPSMTVNPERQLFKCWVCGAGGDVIRFVQLRERIEFPEAVEMLAERFSVDLGPASDYRPAPDAVAKPQLYEAMVWACQQYQQALAEADAAAGAREYVQRRGISAESVREFQLGYAPAAWDWLLRRARNTRFSPDVLEKAGLIVARKSGSGHYDRFHGDKAGRLVFPICDGRGRPIAFGARTLTDEVPKYLNSPATTLFDKSRSLYGIHLARQAAYQQRRLVVMEGYTDCIMAHQMGLKATIGTLGTALTRYHVRALKGHADEVVLVFDGDEAGQKAAERSVDVFLLEELQLRILVLPGGMDPCEYLLANGADAFSSLAGAAQDALEFKLDCVRQANDWRTLEGRRRGLDQVLSALAQAGPTPSTPQQIAIDMVLDRLTHELGVEERIARQRLAELRGRTRPAGRIDDGPTAEAPGEPASEAQAPDGVQRELIEIMLAEPAYVASIMEVVPVEWFVAPSMARIAATAYDLQRQGRSPTHDALIAALQDGDMTELIVDCYEAGANKGRCGQRLEGVVKTIRDEQRRRQAAELVRQLSSPTNGGDDQLEMEKDVLRRLQQSFSGK